MKYTRVISSSLIIISAALFVGLSCSGKTENNADSSQPAISGEATNTSTIEKQDGLIGTFPTSDLPILERVSVLTSLRNQTDNSVIHEAEYVSNAAVSDLYTQYKTTLERGGWTEQKPDTQTVGSIQIQTGTFVRGNDTISIAVQTSAGTKKEIGATTVLLKIEQFE